MFCFYNVNIETDDDVLFLPSINKESEEKQAFALQTAGKKRRKKVNKAKTATKHSQRLRKAHSG